MTFDNPSVAKLSSISESCLNSARCSLVKVHRCTLSFCFDIHLLAFSTRYGNFSLQKPSHILPLKQSKWFNSRISPTSYVKRVENQEPRASHFVKNYCDNRALCHYILLFLNKYIIEFNWNVIMTTHKTSSICYIFHLLKLKTKSIV